MRRVTYFILMLVCSTAVSIVYSNCPGVLCLDMYDPPFASIVRTITGQSPTCLDRKLLGPKVAQLQKYLEAADSGCSGDAVRYKNGMVDSVIRVSIDFRQNTLTQNYESLRRKADRCTKLLSTFLIQPRLRSLFLRDVGKASNGLFCLDCQHCLEKHVNFLLTIFYESTGYTISPFVMAYTSLDDPMNNFSSKDYVRLPIEHFTWLSTGAVAHLPIESVEKSFVHCTLFRPTINDKLQFLSHMIPCMNDHYKALREAVVNPSTIRGTSSEVHYVRSIVSHLFSTLRQPAARRRFELYESLFFDQISPESVPFIMHCIALCLCIEIRCLLHNNSPTYYHQYHKLLSIYAPLFGLDKVLDEQGIHFDFEDEFKGDFFGENMLYKKRFISLMMQIINHIYTPTKS